MDDVAVGIDIAKVTRFQDVRPSLFTAAEWEHAAGRHDSLAGIWCAKEAVVKAVSKWRPLHVRQVEVQWRQGRPHVDLPGFGIDVTISHTEDVAVAVALVRPSP